MGIFSSRYDQPGPGFDPDAPRKTGFARMWEVFTRDYSRFMVLGLLALAASIPFIVGTAIANRTHSLLLVLVSGILGGMIAAPGICGLADALLRSLRDEPSIWWYQYRMTIKQSWKTYLLPGALFGLVFSVQCFTLTHLAQLGSGLIMMLCQVASMLVCLALLLHTVLQLVLMELPFHAVLKNSVLMSIRYLPRTLGASLVCLLYFGAMVLMFPATMFIALLTSLWLPFLAAFVILYPALDESFQIEERIDAKRKKELEDMGEYFHCENNPICPAFRQCGENLE